jgi:hypothetical protein
MFDATDPSPAYQLAWPRQLFVDEATALLAELFNPKWLVDAELLLEEAFTSRVPKDQLRTTHWFDLPADDPAHQTLASAEQVARGFLTHLVEAADALPVHSERPPYWSVRIAAAASTQPVAQDRTQQVQQEWIALVQDLQARGYMDWIAPQGCTAEPPASPAAEVLAAKIEQDLGLADLWPLDPEGWDLDTFYSLIEVVHDLINRPRHRDRHNLPDSFPDCPWHYSKFAPTPARTLYRWHVDQLFDRYGVGLRLAAGGEDMGRLVRAAGDDRDELVEQALQTPNPSDRNAVRHAIALFRSRGVDRENKRSAVLALHRVLEDRRPLIKTELMRKDEGALFQIANEFDLRHSGERQRPDYEDAYLDWIFWWYLATVELTDRIVASQVDRS